MRSCAIFSSATGRARRPTSGATYYPNGRVAEVGEVFRQPNLASTFRTIVAAEKEALQKSADRGAAIRAGRDAFYKGDIARRIADANRAEGGVFTYDDLANFHGSVEKPATTTFHGFEINKAGSWNQGPVLLETLNILEGVDLKAMGANSADYLHNVHEAIKLAYDDRNAYLGDPAFASVPLKGLLSKPYAAERRKQIGPKAFLEHRPGDPYPFDPDVKPPAARYYPHSQGVKGSNTSGDTTCVDTVDKDGNLFSATPSSGWLLGGAFLAGDTGVPLSNRMQVFDLDPSAPTCWPAATAAHDPDAHHCAQGRQTVPRHQHAWRRQPGPADPQRVAERVRVRHGHPGGHRSAARQLDAPAQLVRQPRERAG